MITASLVKELRERTGAGMMDCKKALTETNGDIDKAIDFLRENGLSKAAKKEARIAAEGLAAVFQNDTKAVILEVNSETDFVAKNEEFQEMIKTIGETILNSDAKTVEEAMELNTPNDGTIKDLIVAKTAKIGEKLSFRRFDIVNVGEGEILASYIHMGGKIATLVKINGGKLENAKDVAMQAAAMRPRYTFIEDVPAEEVENEKKVQKDLAMNEGKPEEIAEKMVEGRMHKFYKEICLNEQDFIKDGGKTVSSYLSENGAKLVEAFRYEVGEGLEHRHDDFAAEVAAQANR